MTISSTSTRRGPNGGENMVDWHPLKRWLFTTNHKDVGILYLFTSLYFFVAAGLLALTFRTQLAFPSNTFLQPDEYNQAVTTHGLLMLLWVLTPSGRRSRTTSCRFRSAPETWRSPA